MFIIQATDVEGSKPHLGAQGEITVDEIRIESQNIMLLKFTILDKLLSIFAVDLWSVI